MQPYFAPYLGYFDLIRRCDRWIVFDTAQYIRHGWVNRNRILHPTTGWQYVTVPLQKHSRETPIKDINAAVGGDWRLRIQGQLQHYRGKAPHYKTVAELVASALGAESTSLCRLNVALLDRFCAYLGIPFNYDIFSEMDLSLPPISTPGGWALEISTALGAHEYINPPGGRDLFNAEDFSARGIKLTIQEPRPFVYHTYKYDFVPDLSIIDVLMWNSPADIIGHLSKTT